MSQGLIGLAASTHAFSLKEHPREFPGAQWLGLSAFTLEPGLSPGQGIRSCRLHGTAPQKN